MTQSLQLIVFRSSILLEQPLKPHLCLKHLVKLGSKMTIRNKVTYLCLFTSGDKQKQTHILSMLITLPEHPHF